jgi:hypothetical protein
MASVEKSKKRRSETVTPAASTPGDSPIRASFLRRLTRGAIEKPLRVSGHPDFTNAVRDELLRYAHELLNRAARELVENSPTRRHVVTAADVAAVL